MYVYMCVFLFRMEERKGHDSSSLEQRKRKMIQILRNLILEGKLTEEKRKRR